MKIVIAESSPVMGLLTYQIFCFRRDIVAVDNNIPVMTLSVAADRSQMYCKAHNESFRLLGTPALFIFTYSRDSSVVRALDL